jgi:chorismate dehydratase
LRPAEIAELHADTDSHTSVVLCRLLLRRLHGASPRVSDFNAASHTRPLPASVLLIGDKVVTAAPAEAEYPHQLDLGEAWRDLTGLPFVYATWMCLEDRAADPAIHAAAALLDRQRRRNLARLDRLVAGHAPAHGWPVELAGEYLGRLLRYEVGPREREAAQRFFGMASEAGLLPRTTLRWLEPATPTVALRGP